MTTTEPNHDATAPYVEWPDFVSRFRWKQGEHVSFLGPTGSGKSTLSTSILDLRDYVIVFGTKPKDPTLDKFVNKLGYKKIEKWEPRLKVEKHPRRILWPDASEFDSEQKQIDAFQAAFNHIYRQGSWCIYLDEVTEFSEALGMKREIRRMYRQARSLDISMVGGSQRPAWVPLETYNQATHLFFWRDLDKRNLARMGDIAGGYDSATLIRLVMGLRRFETLYVNTRTNEPLLFRTMPPLNATFTRGG